MNIKFTKMHGAGNDFIVLDGISQSLTLDTQTIRALADRHYGIGADQILLVDTPTHPEADFRYRIFNADGSEVEHCGNGARCFVRFVHEQGLSHRNPLTAEICTGLIQLRELDHQQVQVKMGKTSFNPQDVHFDTTDLHSHHQGQQTLWSLPTPTGTVDLAPVAISNPHAVIVVANAEQAPVAELGTFIESHPRFQQRVNVEFMQIIDRHHIRLRVYERGAGETLACGTGACAAVASGIRQGLLDSPVTVQANGGLLVIEYNGTELTLSGNAVTVFHGEIDITALLKDTYGSY